MEERGGRSDWLATIETPHWAGGSECTSRCCCSGYSPLLQQPTPLFVSVLPMKTPGTRRHATAQESRCKSACVHLWQCIVCLVELSRSPLYTAELLCPIIRVKCVFTPLWTNITTCSTFTRKDVRELRSSISFTIKTQTAYQNLSDCEELENLMWQIT